MNRKMPREAFATEIAPNAGWSVHADLFPGRPDGVVVDVYWAEGTDTPDILIGWAPNHCAAFVFIGQERVNGPTGLVQARQFMEDQRVAAYRKAQDELRVILEARRAKADARLAAEARS